MPQETVGGDGLAGAVSVIYGSANGLSATAARPDQFWTQSSPDIDDVADPGDLFGGSLAAANFGAGSQADLAVGAPGEDVGAALGAGAVNVVYGSDDGLSATAARADQLWTQNSAGVEDVAETNDRFGQALAAVNFGAGSQADLAVGASSETVGGVEGAGAVNVVYGSGDGLSPTVARADQLWTQDSPDVENVAEEGDLFGAALVAANFGAGSQADLAIGVPFEGLGILQSVGAVSVVYGSSDGLSATAARPDQFWSQGTPGVNDATQTNERFGSALAALR